MITKESIKSLLDSNCGWDGKPQVWFSHRKDANRCASVTREWYHDIEYFTVRYFTETRAYIEQFINVDALCQYLNRRQLTIARG